MGEVEVMKFSVEVGRGTGYFFRRKGVNAAVIPHA